MIQSIEQKLERHLAFWQGAPQERPLVSFHVGDHFFSRQFRANAPLLQKGHIVAPEEIHVDDYLDDYRRMAQEMQKIHQDAIYTAEPCTGFPWMEAIFGAKVLGSEVAFLAEPVLDGLEELADLTYSKENGWYRKYLEFTEKLQSMAGSEFTVGQPIIRGVTDTVGSLVGQENMACGMITDPEIMKQAFSVIVEAHRSLIADQRTRISPFHGGYSIGFYNLWAPGSVIWCQEDLAALLAPQHHHLFLKACAQRLIEGYAYSLVHLHPASFAHLDSILEISNLSAVQINKDVGGPTVREMIPECRKVIESGKRVVIGMAFFETDDIDAIFELLPRHSTAIVALANTVEQANSLMAYINSKT